MRWENGTYIKLYRNPSPEFLSLPWQARGLFSELMKVVDRSGLLKCGRLSPAAAVAIAIRCDDALELEEWLTSLFEDGCVTFDVTSRSIVLPNFEDAQKSRQSDKVRKQMSRGHQASPGVTASHTESPEVTSAPSESPTVTGSHLKNRIEENRIEEIPQTPEPVMDGGVTPISSTTTAYAAAEVYTDAVRQRLGGFTMPRYGQDDVRAAVNGHARPGLTWAVLRAKIQDSVGRYIDDRRDQAKFEAGFSPKKWGEWLNSGNGWTLCDPIPEPSREPDDADLPAPLTPEERQAAIAAANQVDLADL